MCSKKSIVKPMVMARQPKTIMRRIRNRICIPGWVTKSWPNYATMTRSASKRKGKPKVCENAGMRQIEQADLAIQKHLQVNEALLVNSVNQLRYALDDEYQHYKNQIAYEREQLDEIEIK